jgi:hypothetical protein
MPTEKAFQKQSVQYQYDTHMKATQLQLHLSITLPKQKAQNFYDTTQMVEYVFISDVKREPCLTMQNIYDTMLKLGLHGSTTSYRQ